ncbi:MAG: hypothetical protein HON90_05425 [Halobacteriovoraceae bacterium]|jgi:hypothetical protein|nr:hypothetical protein [Halobacteriovoraceae bacterium]
MNTTDEKNTKTVTVAQKIKLSISTVAPIKSVRPLKSMIKLKSLKPGRYSRGIGVATGIKSSFKK